MKKTIDVVDESSEVYLGYPYLLQDGKRHLQYHSRFDPEHYLKCASCFEDRLNFMDEPEFQEDEE